MEHKIGELRTLKTQIIIRYWIIEKWLNKVGFEGNQIRSIGWVLVSGDYQVIVISIKGALTVFLSKTVAIQKFAFGPSQSIGFRFYCREYTQL